MSARRSDTGPFSLVPEWVLDAALSPRAVVQYALLSLYADYDTGECWPHRETLASRMGCSVDTVDRANTELVRAGALVVTPPPRGVHAPNTYRVVRTDPRAADLPPSPRKTAARSSRTDAAYNESHLERDSLNDRERDYSDQEQGLDLDLEVTDAREVVGFVNWYAAYPRHEQRADAEKAYLRAVRAGADPERLLAAATRRREGAGVDPDGVKFCKLPSSFLNSGAWEDWVDGYPPSFQAKVPTRRVNFDFGGGDE